MTYYDVYVGDIEDPDFSWEGGDWNGNVPRRLSPLFGHYDAWSELIGRIHKGIYQGKQTDWGGYVAKVSKHEIIEYLDTVCGIDVEKDTSDDLTQCIQGLDENKIYALVAVES